MADRMPTLLVAAYVGALAWIVYEWQRETPIPEDMPVEQATKLTPLRLPSDSIWELEAFEEIVARPPFTQGRRPVESVSDVDTAQADASSEKERKKLSTLRVSAILAEDEQMTALVERGDGSALTLREGNKLEGWRVDRIKDDRIVLALGGRKREMLVYRFGPAPEMNSVRRGQASAERGRRPPRTQQRVPLRAPRGGPQS